MPSVNWPAPTRPDRRDVAAYGYVVYFGGLLLAPVALPPALSTATSLGYVPALLAVLQAVAIGYIAGLALLLRPG